MRRPTRAPLVLLSFTLLLFALLWLMPLADAQRRPGGDSRQGGPRAVAFDTPVPVVSCCGTKPPLKQIPNFSSSTYANFTGQVAVATNSNDVAGTNSPAVVIWDLKNQVAAPLGSQWNNTSVPPTDYYTHPDWSRAVIGEVFGLTLDKNGNIYVATTRVYGTTYIGSATIGPGSPGKGDIYKLDANTGAATRFVQTINTNTYTTGNKIPNTGPGIGNIHYSCDYDNFYVSNFEDGKIYRISSSGAILSLWDHGANLPTATPASLAINDTDNVTLNPSAPFTKRGRRPWAVQVLYDRLYYSIWWTNSSQPTGHPNEIWSIGLDSTGNFIGSARRELVLPSMPSSTPSNPVADISFSPTGKMLLAERTMNSDTNPWPPHKSRLLEYIWNGSAWQPANTFSLGPGLTNSAGGCDYDYGPGNLVWGTGDILDLSGLVYGLQGSPAAGGAFANSILIDLDNNTASQDKTRIGDVEIPCCEPAPPTPAIIAADYTCAVSGQYCVTPVAGVNYTWTVTGGTPSTNTGSCITINWNLPGPKVITVTALNSSGCNSVGRLVLNNCNLELGACCTSFTTGAAYKDLVYVGNGNYTFTSTLTTNMTGVTRVTANILSTSLAYSAASCGTNGPVNSYVTGAQPMAGFTPTLPVPNGDEVIWSNSSGANLSSGVNFSFNIKFPYPPPATGNCVDYLSFCIKYSFTDGNCRTCEVIRCFGPIQRGGPSPVNNNNVIRDPN